MVSWKDERLDELDFRECTVLWTGRLYGQTLHHVSQQLAHSMVLKGTRGI